MSREKVGESFLRLLSHVVLCLGVTYPKAYHKKQLIITILPLFVFCLLLKQAVLFVLLYKAKN